MRLVILTLSTLGCSPTCPGPAQADGAWQVFANVLSRTGGDDSAFPAGSSPINGFTTWTIGWGQGPTGAVDLAIDGQPASAAGVWSSESCGSFELALDGTYQADGASHAFEASGAFLVFDDTLVGTLDWTEQWRAATGETGLLTARAQLQGERR